MDIELHERRVKFLAELPTLLNSSLQTETVIETALKYLRLELEAEAATVFLTSPSSSEVTFWALHGGDSQRLAGKRMPADAGIVGWTIRNKKPLLVNDAREDPRFFSDIDKETTFETKAVICTPLLTRGTELIGAIQVLNKVGGGTFSEEDLAFVEKFSHQAALAIHNAQLYKEAQRQNRQLAVLSRRKDDMISVITHEFQTPINILQNSLELLSCDFLGEDARQKISRTLLNALNRLTSIVSKIRNLSLITSEALKLERKEVSIAEVFEAISTEFESVLTKRNLSLSTTIGEEVTAVSADHTLILVALKNLIANAIRFTPDHGKIALTAEKSTGLVRIAVTDSGIGIEEKEMDLIFEKFYEVAGLLEHSSGTYEFKSCGLGLGLPTVRAIVEAHGSSVNVESTPGKGSCFSFRLPPHTLA